MDLALNHRMGSRPKHKRYANQPFEVQIRSVIQDAWSRLDHKIKYKKSIPSNLKRRINALSALFELADREFKEIRNATLDLVEQATADPIIDPHEENDKAQSPASTSEKTINAFNFLRIASHFFRDFEFEDSKVDDFVHDILELESRFKKSDLHLCLIENLKRVKEYRDCFIANNAGGSFSPYTSIRHCLYLHDRETFGRILSKRPKERFESWLSAHYENASSH